MQRVAQRERTSISVKSSTEKRTTKPLDVIGGLEQDGFGRFPGIDVEIEEKAHEVGVILLGRGKDMPALRFEGDVAVVETGQIAFGLEELENLSDSHGSTLVLDG